jgi:hypothetical protein
VQTDVPIKVEAAQVETIATRLLEMVGARSSLRICQVHELNASFHEPSNRQKTSGEFCRSVEHQKTMTLLLMLR